VVRIGTRPQVPPEHQPDATINVNNPVSGTKYEWGYPPGTPLGTQKNVRIIEISATCTWTAQPTPLEIHLTIDGNNITFGQANPVSGFNYSPEWWPDKAEADQLMIQDGYSPYRAFLIEGRSVKIEAEITGGTVSLLSARVKWARWR